MDGEEDHSDAPDLLFDVLTPLGFRVRVTRAYWELITTVKPPAMLASGTSKRHSRGQRKYDAAGRIMTWTLFDRTEREGRWVCAVAKRPDGDAFLITAYPTDAIKEGISIWPK